MLAIRPRPSSSSSSSSSIFSLCVALALAVPSLAHDSPEHKVEELSLEMARSGKTPALLMERAFEHRALGQLADAAADFAAAFRLDSKLTVAAKELSLIQLAQGNADLALRTINSVLTQECDFLMARAEIQAARKDYRAALQDCEAAFRETTSNLEWYLLRAQLQRRLGLFEDCARDLRAGFSETGSAVLHEELVDAMIDAGQQKAALKLIDPELAESRWRSSWLLRRARAQFALGRSKAAKRDAHAALEELNQRIEPAAPDVTLIIDRSLANALLGETARARKDLDRARSLSADPSMLWRLEKLLRAPADRFNSK